MYNLFILITFIIADLLIKKATPQSQKEQSATAESKKKKEEPKKPEKMEVDESDPTKKAS